jgi:hypothetical protein
MRRLVSIAALVCSIFAVSVQACLWDRDTLAMEVRGLPGITEIITGRFDRYPALYYEMRLQRVSGQLEAAPSNLELYDDAGVACDRLGLSDEAIGWMERKLSVLEGLETGGVVTSEHRYRYLANIGTFYIHRWLKNGADRADMADVERSREFIAAAIELNPDAHFGRERYQLMAIRWLLLSDEERERKPTFLHMLMNENAPQRLKLSYFPRNALEHFGHEDAVEGISGLIQLGAAWESVDVFNALEIALADRGDASVAMLAHLRTHELTVMGHQSFRAQTAFKPLAECTRENITPHTIEDLQDEYFVLARTEADSWVNSRNAYLMQRLEMGDHPDTDHTFWSDWKSVSTPPKLPSRSYWPVILIALGTVLVFCIVVTVFVVTVLKIVKLIKNLRVA